MSTHKTSVVGKWAENIAAHFLGIKGFKILSRNFNTRFGEIDIVAKDSCGIIIFAEVRYRGKGSYLLPEETLTSKKQQRIKTTASIYMNRFGLQDANVRFDVICVTKGKWFEFPKIQYIVDAF